MKEQYLSIADMMSGLMMVFLLIAIVFMIDVQHSKHDIENQKKSMASIAKVYKDNHENLYRALMIEFKEDLNRWNAEILKDNTNTIRFKVLYESTQGTVQVLFKTNESELQPRFKTILQEFFPRYIKVLQNYQKEIDSIKIEGHTSSEWEETENENTNISYLKNMELSQKRALSTLNYCYFSTNIDAEQQNWLRQVLRANGLAFAQLIKNADGSENKENSRRVEFKTVTKSEEKLNEILEIAQ